MSFLNHLQPQLATFLPFSHHKLSLQSPFFSVKNKTVQDYLNEIEQTAQTLAQQSDPIYAEIYATRLLNQFDTLKRAVSVLKQPQSTNERFQSAYKFSKHIHRLPPLKQLAEYRKIARALNEKISWLLEKRYATNDESLKQQYQNQLAETEYRLKKCLAMVEELEEKTGYV